MTSAAPAPAPVATGVAALLEVEPDGHRLLYLRRLVAAAGPERALVLTSARALASEEYATHLEPLGARAEELPAGTRREMLAAAVAHAAAAGAELLVVPDGDRWLLPLLRLLARRPRLPLRVRLLVLRTPTIGRSNQARPAMLVKPILVQLLRAAPGAEVLVLTDAFGVVTRRPGFPGVRCVRDPIDPAGAPEAPPAWFPSREPGLPLVGLFGVVSARKNLPLLAEAAAIAPAAVVVGGRLDPDVRAFLDTPRARALASAGRLVVEDRMLSPAEIDAALAGVDLVSVLQDIDAPSAILAEACVRQTPCLVPAGAWLAEIVAATEIGIAVRMTPAAVAEGIRALARDRDAHVAATRRHAPRVGVDHFTEVMLAP